MLSQVRQRSRVRDGTRYAAGQYARVLCWHRGSMTRWAASLNLRNPADRVFQTSSDCVERGLLDHPSADQAAFTGRQLEMAHGDAHIHALQVSKP